MNTCKYCSSAIADKTVGNKPRSFCNKSCARRYYCMQNPDKVREAGRKSFETIRDTKPDVLKHRGRTTENKIKAYKDLTASGHYKKMSILGQAAMLEKYNDYFIRDKERRTKINNGKWIDYTVFDYVEVKKYTRAVRRLTSKLYGSAGDGYHWDHIVPISTGFKLGLSPDQICAPDNIRKLPAKENLSKGSAVTEEAQSLLKLWNLT